MEFEMREINGRTVYVRKDKKVVPQREDFPGDKIDGKRFSQILTELQECTHNCNSCHGHCGK